MKYESQLAEGKADYWQFSSVDKETELLKIPQGGGGGGCTSIFGLYRYVAL